MRIGFVVNHVETEEELFTTTLLAWAAARRGHEVWELGVGDFACDPEGTIAARARGARGEQPTPADWLAALQGEDARRERIAVSELDLLFLRYDPSAEADERPWAQPAGLLFAELAREQGVVVVNDPRTLLHALQKTYFQQFPEEVRPRTLITRDPEEVRAFVDALGGRAVLKPLQGSQGRDVFLVKDGDHANLKQMIEVILREGYLVAQEYLPAAAEGDIRLFLLEGQPLAVDGRLAAIHRRSSDGDMRSNMHVGGRAGPAVLSAAQLRLAELIRPRLVADRLFLVGIDIAGDRLMEVNVFSPGGLHGAQVLTGRDLVSPIVDALERLVARRGAPDEDRGRTAA